MRISPKSRSAVTAMVDLALQRRAGPVSLATVAARQRVSLSYMEQLFARLRRQGLVEATRGPGGGYTLARAADDISVAEIVGAIEDPPPVPEAPSATDALWAGLDDVVARHLETVKLQSLLRDPEVTTSTLASARKPLRHLPAPAAMQRPRTTAPNSVFAFGMSFAN